MERFKRFLAFLMLHKKLLFLGLAGAGVMGIAPIMLLGGHQVVELVDSSAFCTQTCHSVHYAEAVTYESSPHSEVPCASCHVGDGTKNLVTSKIRGLSDIIPSITGNYPRPIATPLEDRRPSSETCEKCHWSQKFFGDIPQIDITYAPDATNTKSTTTVVLKVNGGNPKVAAGIHWHSTAEVWYLPLDEKRQDIGWMAAVSASGNITEYIEPNRVGEITPERIQNEKRLMDCVDCHNRVSHLFRSPDELIDQALSDGSIDASLPMIKREGLNVLVPQNASLDQAYDRIDRIADFYKTGYPGVYNEKKASVDAAITKLKEIARLTTFPDGLDWNTHPDNVVHNNPDANMNIDWESLARSGDAQGCFRCHGILEKVDSKPKSDLDMVLKGLDLSQIVANLDKDRAEKSTPVAADTFLQSASYAGAGLNALGGNAASSNVTNPDHKTNPNNDIIDDPGPVGKLDAACSLCHSTYKSLFNSPTAPAVSHPIDGLDDCLICHNPTAASPFKTTHPWTTNSACLTCHQSAPKLKPLPLSGPPEEAKPISHSVQKLEGCLTCHEPTGPQPIKPEHPWATDDTCTACHLQTATPKPLPPVTPSKEATAISHSITGLDDCLACHGPSSPSPFKADHPWATDSTCVACHKVSPQPTVTLLVTQPANAPEISHSSAGLNTCLACHAPSGPIPWTSAHPWATDDTCSGCHKPSAVPQALPMPMPAMGPAITHNIAGLNGCTQCHGPSGPASFSPSHNGRTDGLCLACHISAPSQSQQGPLPELSPSPLPGGVLGSDISHPTAGLGDCLLCHAGSGIVPYPADHAGRSNSMCAVCHKPAPVSQVLAVSTGSASSVTTSSAVLSGNLGNLGGASSVSVSIEWGTASGSYSHETTPQTISATGTFQSTATGLNPSTVYYFRAKAVGGSTVYGTESSFTTAQAGTPPSVTTGSATSITAGSATLNGSLTGLGGASSVTVSFQWGDSAGSYSNETPSSTMGTTAPFQASITGLSGSMTYYFRAKAVSSSTSYGLEGSFTTAQAGTPPSVTTNGAVNITPTSATLRGTFNSLGTAPAAEISFQWGTAPGTYANETPSTTMGTTAPFQANINGLASGTTYYFRAKAVGAGTAYGAEMSFTAGQSGTPGDMPVVTTISATDITSSSATLKGSLDSLGNLTSVNVFFQWGTAPGVYTGSTPVTTMGTTGIFQFNITGLSSGTTYYFRAMGTNGTTTVYGTEVNFTTP